MSVARQVIGERILLTLWVGGLWSIGYIVAPTLFAHLEDPALAGTLAGRLFEIIAWIGLVCGGLLLLGNQLREHNRWFNWRAIVLAAMLLLIITGQFFLAPIMAEMRSSGQTDSPSFGQLHGLAAIAYLLTSLLGLILVISPDTNDVV